MLDSIIEVLGILLVFALFFALLLGLPWVAFKLVRAVFRGLVALARLPSRKAWMRAVEALSFLDTGDRVMAGRLAGHEVRVEELWVGLVKRGVRITVDCEGLIPPDLEIVRRGLTTGASGGRDLGDPAFYQAVALDGPEAASLAALGPGARKAIVETCAVGAFKLQLSKVSLQLSASNEVVPALAKALAGVAQGLCAANNPAKALAANVVSEPLEAVRLRCLEVLLREYPARPEATRACEAALDDAAPRIRLLAAAHLGDERSFQVLEKLALAPELEAPVRAQALRALPKLGVPAAKEELFARALGAPEPEIRQAAAWAAGRLKHLPLLEPLCALGLKDPLCAETAAQALGKLGDPRAEPTLLKLLGSDAREIRVACALALGTVGSRLAVAPLLDLKDEGGALGPAARESIRRIQGRLGEAGAGQLSVVPEAEAAGGLSVPAGESGALSVHEPVREKT